MKLTPGRTSFRNIRTLYHGGTFGGLTDGQLLERFANRRNDEAEMAFEVLVERHGPMVLRVCRGILRDDHEAMDAFQATFLVLVREGHKLWIHNSLGPWLHRVACRASVRAKSQERRRNDMRHRVVEATAGSVVDASRNDDAAILHEELDRLPDRYRVSIVLCDLEGRSCEEVAQHLGRPVGTVKSWRARGRTQLKARLVRRGLTGYGSVSIPCLISAFPVLPRSTIEAVVRIATGFGTVGAVPASISALVEGTIKSMFTTKLKTIAVSVLSVGVLASSVGVFAYQHPSPESNPPEPRPRVGAAEPVLDGGKPDRTTARPYYIGDLVMPPGREPQDALKRDASGKPLVDMRPLVDLITTFVAPETWKAFEPGQAARPAKGRDGEVGSITPFYLSATLIIRHTPEVHAQIANFLRLLRECHFLVQPDKAPDPRAERPALSARVDPPSNFLRPPTSDPNVSDGS